MKTGIEIISDERNRQLQVEGYTPEHDDKHDLGELSAAAAAYALRSAGCSGADECIGDEWWPFEWEDWKPSENRVEMLAKAGALIAAEIDRINRS